ncbi:MULTISPECIES: hypothetical protein [unclassified Modestobacter]
MSAPAAAAPNSYRPPHWQTALAASLPERWPGGRVHRWAGRLPLVLAAATLAASTLRLRNGASTDEALALNAGHDQIVHWLTQDGVGSYGHSFPGVPFGYPVLAAALDSVGGLSLVRGFSLACAVAAAVFLAAAVTHHTSRRAGYLTAASFAISGPVAVVAGLATGDALVLALLAAALWCGVTRPGPGAALVTGALLGLAPVVEYRTVVFVPVVLLAVLLMARSRRHGLRRSGMAAAAAVSMWGAAWLLWADGIRGGVLSTTWYLQALGPRPRSELFGWLALDVGVLLVVAAAGVAVLRRQGAAAALLAVVLLCGGLIVPLTQLRVGESVSFDRNLAWSALFLAPLAGVALAALSRRTWKLGPVFLILGVALLFGVSRSGSVYATWPDVAPVAGTIAQDATPGRYFASGTAVDPLAYHTRDLPGVHWENTYALYAQGDDAVRVAIEDLRYQTVVLNSASTGSPVEDARQAVLLQALRDNSADYRLVASIPVDEHASTAMWSVYQQVGAAR